MIIRDPIILYGFDGAKKEERAVLPDRTVHCLSAFWMADPQLSFSFAQETQTELCFLPVNMIDTDTNTELKPKLWTVTPLVSIPL